jgi:hypothetical protein
MEGPLSKELACASAPASGLSLGSLPGTPACGCARGRREQKKMSGRGWRRDKWDPPCEYCGLGITCGVQSDGECWGIREKTLHPRNVGFVKVREISFR